MLKGTHIREVIAADIPFVVGAWLRDQEEAWTKDPSGAAVKTIRPSLLHDRLRDSIHHILLRSTVFVCADNDAPDNIVGFICFEPKTLHYVYVKGAFREAGVALSLFNEAGLPLDCKRTHNTFGKKNRTQYLIQKYLPSSTYDPFYWQDLLPAPPKSLISSDGKITGA